MLIIGAGMAGLLAGHMLRRHSPTIVEQQAALPHNHAALLRFRTLKAAEATGIPFTEVLVRKAVMSSTGKLRSKATLADNNAYSVKVTGEAMDRSVLDLRPATRYIAPSDFIAQMAKNLNIKYEYDWHATTLDLSYVQFSDSLVGGEIVPIGPFISTVPMPVLMKMVGWDPMPEFRWKPIWTVTTQVMNPRVNLYQTIYSPSLGSSHYRASLTGDQLIIEYASEPSSQISTEEIQSIMRDFGIRISQWSGPICKRQEYGKLLPIAEMERKSFIMAMTDQYNIWSLGRFATWRQILLDDVVDDIRFIDRVITEKDQYARRLHHHNS